MILVNVTGLNLTILLQNREKPIAWESSFLLLRLLYQGVFSKGNIALL